MTSKAVATISLNQIYRELCELKVENQRQHEEIILKISNYKNQVINLKFAIAGCAALAFSTLGWFIIHLQH